MESGGFFRFCLWIQCSSWAPTLHTHTHTPMGMRNVTNGASNKKLVNVFVKCLQLHVTLFSPGLSSRALKRWSRRSPWLLIALYSVLVCLQMQSFFPRCPQSSTSLAGEATPTVHPETSRCTKTKRTQTPPDRTRQGFICISKDFNFEEKSPDCTFKGSLVRQWTAQRTDADLCSCVCV